MELIHSDMKTQGTANPDDVIKAWRTKWSWLQGEPTVLGFLKATNDAIEWFSDDVGSVKIGYGIVALLRDANAFLDGYKPKPHDCPCELCCAARTLRQNIERLTAMMRS